MHKLTQAILVVNGLVSGLSAFLLQDRLNDVVQSVDRVYMFLGTFLALSFSEAYLLNLIHSLSKKRYGWSAAILFLPGLGLLLYMILKSKRLFPFGK